MSETPKKRGPGRPRKHPVKEKRRTKFWSATTNEEYKRIMRAYLVALSVSREGDDHLADLKTVDARAEDVIDFINLYRGLK